MEFHDPKNKAPIPTLWAFLSEDAEGNQGIVSGGIKGSGQYERFTVAMVPLVTGNPELLPAMRRLAEEALRLMTARGGDKKIVLYKFTAREAVEEVE